jgi:hypothetical protein
MAIDFKKILAEKYNIHYGPEGSYEEWPKQFECKAYRNGNETIVTLVLLGDYVHVEKGAVTGYESAKLDCLLEPFNCSTQDWHACAGGMGWDKLVLKRCDYMPVLIDMIKVLKLK